MKVSKRRRAAAIAAYTIMQRKSRRPKRKHSCWVREWILKREEYGAYHALKVAIHVKVTVDSLVQETVERTCLRDST